MSGYIVSYIRKRNVVQESFYKAQHSVNSYDIIKKETRFQLNTRILLKNDFNEQETTNHCRFE